MVQLPALSLRCFPRAVLWQRTINSRCARGHDIHGFLGTRICLRTHGDLPRVLQRKQSRLLETTRRSWKQRRATRVRRCMLLNAAIAGGTDPMHADRSREVSRQVLWHRGHHPRLALHDPRSWLRAAGSMMEILSHLFTADSSTVEAFDAKVCMHERGTSKSIDDVKVSCGTNWCCRATGSQPTRCCMTRSWMLSSSMLLQNPRPCLLTLSRRARKGKVKATKSKDDKG